MLEVRRLRLLRELSVRGTIAEVATALHQSPSSVSQQLSQLEREVGVELLRKSGRRLQLTAQGEILVDHAARILDDLDRAESALAASQEDAVGTVRIAVFQSLADAADRQQVCCERGAHFLADRLVRLAVILASL